MDICIIGTGYVGLVSAACFAETGNNVWCIDKNTKVVDRLKSGEIPIYEPGLKPLVHSNVAEGRLKFSTNLKDGVKNSFFLFICVGTPSKEDGSCDLSYIYDVANSIGMLIDDYKIIITKSTVPVGTADNIHNIIQKKVEERGLDVEFDVVSNPEFLKEGDAVNDFMKPDRIILGTRNVRTTKLLEMLYGPFAQNRDKIITMSVRSAEMTKYAANCMLATKISFINEIANICEMVDADVGDVRIGIGSDHRIGYHFIYPGLGYGGSCFPKDVKALVSTAHQSGYVPQLLQTVDTANQKQKVKIAEKVLKYFNEDKKMKELNIAMWGLSFKAKTDDIRESAALETIKVLTDKGIKIRAYDPFAGEKAQEELSNNPLVEISYDQYDIVNDADALVVVTDWNQFKNPDFTVIKEKLKSAVIFDGRNLYSPSFMKSQGFKYFSIGR